MDNISIQNELDARFPVHPFSHGIGDHNVENVLVNYLAMSQAFPYLQSGSQAQLILNVIDSDGDVPDAVELTSVVGNFLAWDETGGHQVVMRNGMADLSKILNSRSNFHSNQLRQDIAALLGRDIAPSYSDTTRVYLKSLFDGLADRDHVRRVAYMVAFEFHAGRMIEALWEALVDTFAVDKDNLLYFKIHVGGDDPAEAYHIEMTQSLINKIVTTDEDRRAFLSHVAEAYALNMNWCQSIKQ
ncbi:MAG: hypothetical protein INF02_01565 [Phenylobacterium sp.]|jgi:hypothetical protein|uniref:hypothetical protein n=1 Tax=Phenylobacterium sp. TaxID=1871053 RepID=UPI0025F2FE05|nr:hypothetical protein [Phenylobacterium sp.]MCA3708465.1 hypothetical protein [Phenylobacterium sp.]